MVHLVPGWACYLRVSTEDQQTPERSFAMQLTDIRERLLNQSDLPLIKTYEDILTGTRYDRSGFQAMLSDARAGRFSHLAIYRVDRFGRDTIEGLQVAKDLRRIGIHVVPASNPSLDITTPDGWMLFTIMLGFGEHEVAVLAKRTHDGMRNKVESGQWAWNAPDGFINCRRDLGGKKREAWIEIDPIRSPIIREAWELLLDGQYSLEAICDELDARGYLRRDGKRWAWTNAAGKRQRAAATLSRIFHNPLYAGWIVSEGFGIKWGQIRSTAGALVSDAEWQRAQEILAENTRIKRNAGHAYLLQGMARLELTPGETIALRCATVHDSAGYYFIPRQRLGIDEAGVYLPAAVVDARIPDLLASISLAPELLPQLHECYTRNITEGIEAQQDAKVANLKRRLSELLENEKKYARLWAEGRLGDQAYDDLQAEARADAIRAQTTLAHIERGSGERIRDLDRAAAVLAGAWAAWPLVNYQERRQILRCIFREIRVSLTGALRPSPLHAPFAYLVDAAQSVTRVTQCAASTCMSFGTPERN